MKSKFVVGLLCWGLLFSCNTGKQETTTTDDPTKFPILKFDQPEVDLGKVTEGDSRLVARIDQPQRPPGGFGRREGDQGAVGRRRAGRGGRRGGRGGCGGRRRRGGW